MAQTDTEGRGMKEWLTIAEAAKLAGRHHSAIYRWIDNGQLIAQTAGDGTLEVESAAVLKAEAKVKRGRPRGSVSTKALTRKGNR